MDLRFRAVWAALAIVSLSCCAPAIKQPATPTPTASASPLAVPLNAPPQIVAVELSSYVVHSGDTLTGDVITTTNVSSVRLELAGRDLSLPKIEDGKFGMTYQVPEIPFFLRRSYVVHVVATTASGATATRDVTVRLE